VIVLDTNVLSELMRPQPDPQVMAWGNELEPQAIAITTMNEAEIVHGLARLPFSSEAAHWYGELVSRRERMARPISTADAVIAATTLAHGAQLATRNTSDFEAIGLELVNPSIGLQPSPHTP